ncbi:SDR family oxidoreductase [Pseudonocardia sp. NPDC049154]|uniref:SDR family NAD(P)-dependent oxidoreductase n=1 Tax=Pseudonocardia sp. NPDC049154 TaxID=3155501 RepID=UPI0033D3A156
MTGDGAVAGRAGGALAGKAVVVTGGGRGIGRQYALRCAAEGAAVVVNDRDAEVAEEVAAEIGVAGGRAVAHPADIVDWDLAQGLVARCVDEFGAIDGLVNNAGEFDMCPAPEVGPELLRRILDVNVLGTAHCGIHAMRAMLTAGRGSIVNVTSGAHAGMAAMSVYGASKGAVASLTYTWALELEGTGVRVNAVSPLAATRMSEVNLDYRGLAGEERDRFRAMMPAPECNAPAVAYLLSDAAAAVHGQVVRIDHEEISLLTHPMIRVPGVPGAGGSVAAVAAAFAGPLADSLLPNGFVVAEVDVSGRYERNRPDEIPAEA